MAVEAKRGCGFRKVGGLYMVGGGVARGCGKLPLALTVCKACGQGIKQTRGWTWINPTELFAGSECRLESDPARDLSVDDPCRNCPISDRADPDLERAGLIWVGKSFYPTPAHFMHEGDTQGICRRIRSVPKGFEISKTWVFLAHPEAMTGENEDGEDRLIPGVFRVWRPEAIEKIVTESQHKDTEEMEKLAKRGITPVVVPDDDPDHQGSVYEKEADSEA